ncbi:hypothetical protein [Marinoscillum sp. MHG1-6]|uniref:hypothetical protein n=1 Tax=Marinoscillum sp. MHG1-6 TaxID=2959627 RepID=UPI0021587D0D|nr:hypothetical protein [Marinoscillum sp. MHG1-6]
MSTTSELEELYLKKLELKLESISPGSNTSTDHIFGSELDEISSSPDYARPIGEAFLKELSKIEVSSDERKESQERFREQALNMMYEFLERKLRKK